MTLLPDLQTKCKILWAKVQISASKSLTLGCFHRPPDSKISTSEELVKSLDLMPKNSNQTIVRSRLLCMFKILNELVEIPINDRLIPADRRTRGGHNQAYKHIRANTTLGQNSFWHRTIPDWNSLPAGAIESKTVAAFKSQLVD